MIEEIRKSVNSTLYERFSNPLYGTILISWLICNWEIIFMTLLIKSENICETKIKFIENNTSIYSLLVSPLILTLIFSLIVPFISNLTFWIKEEYKHVRIKQYNKINRYKTKTIEESNRLRNKLEINETKYNSLVDKKKQEIKVLVEYAKVLAKRKNVDFTEMYKSEKNKENEEEFRR